MKKMRNYKFTILSAFALLFVLVGCQDEDQEFGDIIAPTNLEVEFVRVGENAENPFGDGTGTVHFSATADDALSFQYSYNGSTTSAPGGLQTYDFAVLGTNTYSVTVIAFGTGGTPTSKTVEVDVLSLYEPPADLVQMLYGNGSRTWRIKAEQGGHFGLGPVGGTTPTEWYGAGAFEKEDTGMYDDRYIFNADGTFTHITNSVNDDPVLDETGTVFGRVVLIEELGPHSEEPNGADIENYPYIDYSEQHTLTAPGGVETISLTGLGFMGYYTGGNHKYQIFSRSANEMLLTTGDGNNEFNWWFILVPE